MINSLKLAIQFGVGRLTGHRIGHISSFAHFVEFMYMPVDGSSLAMGRIMFGLMMLIDIPEERGGSILDIRYGGTTNCFFPLISLVKPLTAPKMGIIYLCLWLGALGITLGYKFRLSAGLFVITYWYIFLLDKSVWNNHSYLYGLCGILFLVSSSHKNYSIDALRNKKDDQEVPFWNYVIIKYQFCVLYTVAGLKKFSSEWLSGYAMMNLSHHWVFWPFRAVLGEEFTDIFIVHWFVCIFDMFIIFWIIYEPTRKAATILCATFHLMNSRLFSIGMFPWVCLAELPLFYDRSWPKLWLPSSKSKNVRSETERFCKAQSKTARHKLKFKQKFIVSLVTTLTVVEIVDQNNNGHHFLHPNSFSVNDRWTKHPDMAFQYAHCIRQNLIHDFLFNDQSRIGSLNLSIYFDAWSSLNGRFQQRMFDPSVDMLKVHWSPFKRVQWMKPLLQQFTSKRIEMQEIARDVLSWNNFSDVMFIADFPDQNVESYISTDLDNVTLTVLDGEIAFQDGNLNILHSLKTGERIHVIAGKFHKVTTISRTPSCYMYTYVNRTMQDLGTQKERTNESILPIWSELTNRAKNFKQFFINIQNSLLFELFEIPMPKRIKSIS